MEYTLLRYRDTPTDLTRVLATADAALAVALVRRWRCEHPEEGIIMAIGAAVVVHCRPGWRPQLTRGRRAAAVVGPR